MTGFDPSSLFIDLVFGSIGFALFAYGKKADRWPQLVAGLLLIIGSALLWGSKAASPPEAVASGFSVSSFGVALIASLLAYDGWVQLTFVAGEIRNPQRNVFLALTLGSVACIAIYLLANVAYLRVLPIAEIAASDHVGATVARRVLGSGGGSFRTIYSYLCQQDGQIGGDGDWFPGDSEAKLAKAVDVIANWVKDGYNPSYTDYPSTVALFTSDMSFTSLMRSSRSMLRHDLAPLPSNAFWAAATALATSTSPISQTVASTSCEPGSIV